ncbi:hypothetical protein GC087_06840 [Pantoea sp. JZ2]|uniref:hypothetical protein n=1 Tax=Pantoea sp. JZ2 TaxID=2654189 RepID=UPI002B4A314D|nr:hypothetical protein [Pantoea sp. JZ2]WRH12351.1 hypothetical protein GC087_06840 [Pantoea sp. JZ2]
MTKEIESNVGSMAELTEFDTIYSAIGRLVIVDLSMKDSMAGHIPDPKEFPDMTISMRADMARKLAEELLECADAIDAGKSHPSIKFND